MDERIEELTQRFRRLPPRSAQALWFRLLEGRSSEECARRYGISLDAFEVMLLRAARELAAAAEEAPSPPLPPFAQEKAEARPLAASLEANAVLPGAPVPEANLLLEVATLAGLLRRALLAAERAEETSPRRRREELLRRLLVAAILLLTAYLYLRGQARS